MIDELIAGIVLFKNFILLTLAAGIIGSLLAVIGTRKFSWNGRARGVYGFLINRSDHHQRPGYLAAGPCRERRCRLRDTEKGV